MAIAKIKDQTVYEFGILSRDCMNFGNHSNQPTFQKSKLGAWPGNSLSWPGATFRATDRTIKTFADFLQKNPYGWPTNKTFYFYEVLKDSDGNRKVMLIHEGAFQDPGLRAQGAPAYVGMSLNDGTQDNGAHESAASRMTIARMQEGIIEDLRMQNSAYRAQVDMLNADIARMREENTQRLNDKIESERAQTRWEVEKEAVLKMHKAEIDALKEHHEAVIKRMQEDFEREIERIRDEEYENAAQALGDEMDQSKAKLIDGAGKFLENLPNYIEVAKAIGAQVGLYKPAATQTALSAPNGGAPQADSQNTSLSGAQPSPFDDAEDLYMTAEAS